MKMYQTYQSTLQDNVRGGRLPTEAEYKLDNVAGQQP